MLTVGRMVESGMGGSGPERHRPGTLSGRVVTAVLVTAIVATATLVIVFTWLNRAEKRMLAQPRGAGAGQTGLYNQYGGLGKGTEATVRPPGAQVPGPR